MSAPEAEVPLAAVLDAKTAKALGRLGFETADEVLRYFPRRYLVPGRVTRINELELGEQAIVYGTVHSVNVRPMRNRKGSLVSVVLTDDAGGMLDVTFFNQPWLEKQLPAGRKVIVTGKVGEYRGSMQLASPTWLNPTGEEEYTDAELEKPMPIYRARKGMSSARMQRIIRQLLEQAEAGDGGETAAGAVAPAGTSVFADVIPESVRADQGLPTYRQALRWVHQPADESEPEAALRYFKFEEAFVLQTELYARKFRISQEAANPLGGKVGGLLDEFDQNLPFDLTRSQRLAGNEISQDLAKPTPMNRLLHGDVGSGKTLVALRAMLQAVDSGKQAALLAPTEILAAQHYQSIAKTLGELVTDGSMMTRPDGVRIALLTGSMSTKDRRTILNDLVTGTIDIIVGTHALMSETTMFFDLGLVVIDEQHRFGVGQREALRAKGGGAHPHTLVMTATPIPRTVAMTVFGDLDTSTLTDLPGGPKQITTHVVSLADHPQWLARVWEVLAENVHAGNQAFVVTSRIETETDPVDSEGRPQPPLLGVEDMAERLRALPQLEGVRIETLHGRSDQDIKDTRMTDFAAGEFDVLVATTVIEVGVDIPKARLIVIYDADRFGVAQLHQLRGRVGRDGSPALCFLVTLQPHASEAMERLQMVASTLDGFALSDFDLDTRREGDVLGKSQWGAGTSLRYLSVIRDEAIIVRARQAAVPLVEADPQLEGYPLIRAYVARIVKDEDETYLETS